MSVGHRCEFLMGDLANTVGRLYEIVILEQTLRICHRRLPLLFSEK